MAPLAAAAARQVADRTVMRGDRIETVRMGVAQCGHVEFVSALQVLVKWDNGRSSGLRLDRGDQFRLV